MANPRCRAYCAFCETEQIFRHSTFPHGIHQVVCVFTLGLWTISYLALYWRWRQRAGWRCTECGHRYRVNRQVNGKPGAPPPRPPGPTPEVPPSHVLGI